VRQATTAAAVNSVGQGHRVQETVTALWVSFSLLTASSASHVRLTAAQHYRRYDTMRCDNLTCTWKLAENCQFNPAHGAELHLSQTL